MDEMEKTQIGELMSFLCKNKNDRGVMADLRRGFSRTTESRTWPHIAQFCDLRSNRNRRIAQLIAAGFATCGESSNCGNFGETMRQIATGNGKKNDGLKTFENRFRRLLSASNTEEICDFLPGIIRTAKTKSIPVNFFRLFEDLQYWGENVKINWAASYWVADKKKGGEVEDEISDQNNG